MLGHFLVDFSLAPQKAEILGLHKSPLLERRSADFFKRDFLVNFLVPAVYKTYRLVRVLVQVSRAIARAC